MSAYLCLVDGAVESSSPGENLHFDFIAYYHEHLGIIRQMLVQCLAMLLEDNAHAYVS